MSKSLKQYIKNYFLIFLGALLISFGSTVFLSESELVAGGVSGIGVIAQHFTDIIIYDYVVAAITLLSLVAGYFLIGKDFFLKTVIASILYIGFTFLFKRVPAFVQLGKEFAGKVGDSTPTPGNLMLCGFFGGIFVGCGVGCTFLGGGSTGGVDVIQVYLRKKFNIKESISSPVIDIVIILVGMVCMQIWVPALCGIISSGVTAIMIDIVYIKNQSSYQIDIISSQWEKIQEFVQKDLDRGSTLIPVKGGFTGNDSIILRVVIDKNQYEKTREFIASVDQSAFITITQTNAVYGEGFKSNTKLHKKHKK